MRVVRVVTNETCDHRCRFCDARRSHERASVAAADAVRKRIARGIDQEPRELVLTGGEPTLRRDLGALVRHAKQCGAHVVTLETNGSNIDDAAAASLRAAGLDRARLHVPAWGDALDALTSRPGAHAALLGAAAALHRAGVHLEASIPVVRENVDDVAALPQHLAEYFPVVERVWIRIPQRAPDPRMLAPLSEALPAVAALAETARSVGITVALDPATYVPPCLFDRPARVAHLFALNAGAARRVGHRRIAACADCAIDDRCPGVPDGIDIPDAHPIVENRVRRRLTVISSVQEQIARELVTHETYRRPDGTTIPAAIVRINFHCNQACEFCFVSTHLPPATDAQIERAIDEIGGRAGVLVLSGGEPTLNPRLPELVRRGRAAGATEVELQTNAVRLADPKLVEQLERAGVDIAFVSLHAATAPTSDKITSAPGTFERTVEGLDRLAASQIAIRINYVFCRHNHREFVAFVDMVGDRWPNAAITVSFVAASTDLVPRTRELVPRYTDVLPALERGLARAHSRGIEVQGFDSMCGIPLCLAPGDPLRFTKLAPIAKDYDAGEFVKPDACTRCVLKTRCFGLRRGYAELHGADELRPVAAPDSPAHPHV